MAPRKNTPLILDAIEAAFRSVGVESPRLRDVALDIFAYWGGPPVEIYGTEDATTRSQKETVVGLEVNYSDARPETSRKELLRLRNAAAALLRTIQSTHGPALNAACLSPNTRAFLDLSVRLGTIVSTVDSRSDCRFDPKSGLSGKTDSISPRIAYRVAEHYSVLTGRRPTVSTKDGTAYGPFLDLVGLVFTAFGIKASAEAFARKATKRFNKEYRLKEELPRS